MRTNIDIDDKLLSEARDILGTKTKKETVETALTEIVQHHNQLKIKQLRGIGWEGDLEAWRAD